MTATRQWLERAVIGLNLCPFAKAVHVQDRIRYFVSRAETPDALRGDLVSELRLLAAADPNEVETTLLVHPRVLERFADYNEFLQTTDAVLDELDLTGELQIASFHPDYRFVGSAPDDIENYTNRSPYPILHLLREASITRALDANPDSSLILDRNVETLRALGRDAWNRLLAGAE